MVNLMNGVDRFGCAWKKILFTYDFDQVRSHKDLKNKYYRMRVGIL